VAAPAFANAAESGVDFFEKRVRPVLVQRCYECHSTGNKVKGGLRLDTRDSLLKGGDSGPVIVPGKPDKSLLIKAVRYASDDLQMPPKHRLEPNEVEFLEKWVAMGAPDPRTNTVSMTKSTGSAHWAFRPLHQQPVPNPANERWPANDVDRFVLVKLERRGLEPSPAADRRTLIRRATFDLIGLPPTPEEIENFLNDRAPGSFERVVDRLLSSPHYGERWGRHWLDLVRYADTAGDSSDYPVPQAYRYRDYVVKSFNDDKPYDRFLREQIAGDLLPADSPKHKRELITATGYIAIARRFSVEPASAMHLTIEDTLDTIGRSVLGLSLSCARCHDHKFDPVSMRDYYALYGIFSSTRYPYAGSEEKRNQSDFVPLYSEAELDSHHIAERTEYYELDREATRVETQLALLEKEGLKDRDLKRELTRIRRKRDDGWSQTQLQDTAYAVAEGKPGDARIHLRGEPSKQGEAVPRAFLTVLGGQRLPAEEKGSGRLQLADWLTSPENPLTPRVMVNRIWQHHFSKGLVATTSDFGARGRAPTHPELLDYLAVQFVKSGWSLKAMHKLIMMSRTYQQTSADDPTRLALDPGNDLLWKHGRQRLDAESLRDALLAVSGTLEYRTAGSHPFPPPTRWEYTQHNQFTALYETRQRSIYLMQQRIRRHPFMATFDGADPNTSTAERPVTTTPLQALFALNDSFAHEQAERFAERIMAERGNSATRIQRAYELSYGRQPSAEETRGALAFLRETSQRLESLGNADPQKDSWASLARAIMASNEFIFVD
jgi:uncharacterized protein DUF1553/uncharacterized protein DUF1549/cytochrome c